jgi:hypothetical protein
VCGSKEVRRAYVEQSRCVWACEDLFAIFPLADAGSGVRPGGDFLFVFDFGFVLIVGLVCALGVLRGVVVGG